MLSTRLVLWSLGLLTALTGCIPSNVVAREDRAVVPDKLGGLPWQPAVAEDLPGLWHSVRLEGPLAGSLQSLSYWFEPAGAFTGAALFLAAPPTFQVLDGRYSFAEPGQLELGEGTEPARAETAEGGLLRLAGADGTVILRREEQR